jgi:hypothetical protein
MNRLLAAFKVVLLFTVFVAGVKTAKKEGVGHEEFNAVHGDRNSLDGLAAMVLILYAYQGWENANYVSLDLLRYSQPLTINLRLLERLDDQARAQLRRVRLKLALF